MAGNDYRRLKCSECSTSFDYIVRRGRPATTCSPDCKKARALSRNRQWSKVQHGTEQPDHWSKVSRSCRQCNKTFMPKHRVSMYCGQYCKGRAFDASRGIVRLTREQFLRNQAELCGQRLRAKAAAKRARDEKRSEREAARVAAAAQRAACNGDPEKRRSARRASKQRYRARLKAASLESFTDLEIFERDGWFCQLCCKPVSRSLLGNCSHPDAPTLDHIVSLNRGGTHCRGNVQCLCRSCNSVKSDGEACGIRAIAGSSEERWLSALRCVLLAWKDNTAMLKPLYALHIADVYATRAAGGALSTFGPAVS